MSGDTVQPKEHKCYVCGKEKIPFLNLVDNSPEGEAMAVCGTCAVMALKKMLEGLFPGEKCAQCGALAAMFFSGEGRWLCGDCRAAEMGRPE